MEKNEIQAAVVAARKAAAHDLKGEKIHSLIHDAADENGNISTAAAILIAVQFADAYSDRVLIETLSRLLK